MNIKDWFKEQTPTAKLMIVLVAMLLIAIATRWGYIQKEASDAVKERLQLDDFRVMEKKS